MAYQGVEANVRIGRAGLLTDQNPTDIPDTHLIQADNVEIQNGIIQKERGSRRWNRVALGSGITDLLDYMAAAAKKRLLVLTKAGTIFKFRNREERVQLTAAQTTDPTTLTVNGTRAFLVEGGEENPLNDKKAFIFTGNDQIQVITADEDTYTTIKEPATDWNSTKSEFPRIGVVHQNRLWVFLGHRGYASDPDDHEQFITNGVQFPIGPGDGERVVDAQIFKGRLFVFKKPFGVYVLEDSSASTSTWFFRKISGEFGTAGPKASLEITNDLLVSNASGTVTSLAATDKLGDVESGDIFAILNAENYIRNRISLAGLEERRGLYYENRKVAYMSFRAAGQQSNMGIFKIDFSKQRPELTLVDKDQVNAFVLRGEREKTPFYGADDGYVYEMDQVNREVLKVFKPGNATVALAGLGAGNLDNATYRYKVTFADASNESNPGAPSQTVTVADNSVDGQVALSAVPVDSTQTATKRRIFRKKETQSLYQLVGEIGDNTTTTFTDNIAEGSLTNVQPPSTNTFNTAYKAEFQTPHLNFGYIDPSLAQVQKIFDFIEIPFIPTGRWNISMDYFIDGIFKETRTAQVSKGAVLDDFTIDNDRLQGNFSRSVRFRLKGAGRTLSVRIRNEGLMENFKISGLRVYFRKGNQDQKASSSGRTT